VDTEEEVRRQLSLEEITKRCPGCRYARWQTGALICSRVTCKYLVKGKPQRQPGWQGRR